MLWRNNYGFKEEFAMKGFWKDYAELWKDTGRFYKKHWLGVIVMNAVIICGEFAYFYRNSIKDAVKSKFKKEKEES